MQWRFCALGMVFILGGMMFLTSCLPLTPSDSGPRLSDPAAARARSQALTTYHQAWRAVTRDFLDPTFNGQAPDVWRRWRHRYDAVIETPEDAYAAIDAMLASLGDDYTRFLRPREMREQTMEIDSRVFGVGIQIALRDARVTVMGVLPHSPAAAAGMAPRDVIAEIDGAATRTMTLEDAADRIRGPEGSPVRLTVLRPLSSHQSQTLVKTLRRAEVSIQSVFVKPLAQASEIGYIRLNSFISEKADDEIREALKNLRAKRALILDLRHNYGGLLSNAVIIADQFLDRGEIVSIVGRHNRTLRVERAVDDGDETRVPMAILIDGGSASASEILSGALQDHGRASLVGERSFGKGLVQKIEPLSDGSGLNITISKYLTPNGTDINHKGITPDIVTPLTLNDVRANHDAQLQAAIATLRRQLAARRPAS